MEATMSLRPLRRPGWSVRAALAPDGEAEAVVRPVYSAGSARRSRIMIFCQILRERPLARSST